MVASAMAGKMGNKRIPQKAKETSIEREEL
jgi:hypothetical protein